MNLKCLDILYISMSDERPYWKRVHHLIPFIKSSPVLQRRILVSQKKISRLWTSDSERLKPYKSRLGSNIVSDAPKLEPLFSCLCTSQVGFLAFSRRMMFRNLCARPNNLKMIWAPETGYPLEGVIVSVDPIDRGGLLARDGYRPGPGPGPGRWLLDETK